MRRNSKNRKQEILAIAARVFRQKGYDATSMDDLAGECKLFKGSLYHYFKSKEDILQQVVQSGIDDSLPDLERINRMKTTPVKKLRKYVEIQMRAIVMHRDAVSVALREERAVLTSYRKTYIVQRDLYESYLADILKEGMEKGVFRKMDVKLTTKALLGMCNWASVWFHPGGSATWKTVAELFADLMISGLEPKGGGAKTPIERDR